jgi:MFS family permease
MNSANDRRLFWACFIALITTAFGFIIRAMIMNEWQTQFGLTETQKGEIFGVGLWPFAISIVLFSLVIDYIGYGRAMVFAFICHIASAVVTICAPLVLADAGAEPEAVLAGQRAGYWMLYLGNFIVGLGNGTVEAVINPVVATMFSREKTKWLNILHAGWPGGLVFGGLLTISMSAHGVIGSQFDYAISWQWKVALILIPTLLYGIMMIGRSFPVSERVAAGVPYKAMLQEAGILGALIVVGLIVSEVGRVFEMAPWLRGNIINFLVMCYGVYVLTFGRPMFVFLLLIMIPLATTELGTDSWITPLLEGEMHNLHLDAGWVLVYTSLIMFVLRFFAGPIVHTLSPLGLLALSSVVAAAGLFALSSTTGMYIFLAATLYGFGKTFFWPTMLGVVAEQFPKGGALTLNAMGGVGMLSVGVLGTQFLGFIQDKRVDTGLAAYVEQADTIKERVARELEKQSGEKPSPAALETALAGNEEYQKLLPKARLHNDLVTEKKDSLFGEYLAINQEKRNAETELVAKAKKIKADVTEEQRKKLGDFPTDKQLDEALAANSEYQKIIASPGFDQQKLIDDTLEGVKTEASKSTLRTSVIFPVFMFACYMILIIYFRSKGGYKAQVLTGHAAHDEKFTGGVEGPVEA